MTVEEQGMGLDFMVRRNFAREKNVDGSPIVEILKVTHSIESRTVALVSHLMLEAFHK